MALWRYSLATTYLNAMLQSLRNSEVCRPTVRPCLSEVLMFEPTANIYASASVTESVLSWASWSVNYKYENLTYSSFTRVIWKNTTEVGCAFADCAAGTIDKKAVCAPSSTHTPRSNLRTPCRPIECLCACITHLAIFRVEPRMSSTSILPRIQTYVDFFPFFQ